MRSACLPLAKVAMLRVRRAILPCCYTSLMLLIIRSPHKGTFRGLLALAVRQRYKIAVRTGGRGQQQMQ